MTHSVDEKNDNIGRSGSQSKIDKALRHAKLFVTIRGQKKFPNNNRINQTTDDVAVYFIHGTADRPDTMSDLARGITRKSSNLHPNISSVVLAEFDGRLQGRGIPDFAEQLGEQIRKNGHKKVILVGHSRGGLIATEFAQHLSRDMGVEVMGISTLCTPFAGAKAITKPMTLFSESVAQMHQDSEYLGSLNQELNSNPVVKPEKFKFYAADQDTIVAPQAAQISKQGEAKFGEAVVIDENAHQTILVDNRMIKHITEDCNAFVTPALEESKENTVETPSKKYTGPLFVPAQQAHYYKKNGYVDEDIALLQKIQTELAADLEKNPHLMAAASKATTFQEMHGVLLDILQEKCKTCSDYNIKEAGERIHAFAQGARPSTETQAKRANISLMAAINVMNHPGDPEAVNALNRNATLHASGKNNKWKGFADLGFVLVGAAALFACSASIPVLGPIGLAGAIVGGSMLMAGMGRLFYTNRNSDRLASSQSLSSLASAASTLFPQAKKKEVSKGQEQPVGECKKPLLGGRSRGA